MDIVITTSSDVTEQEVRDMFQAAGYFVANVTIERRVY